ncbi:sensor histidine kinase [Amycolatopsis anabasis]|uniref:sensor histidine kinase n=1 Tax=Amycolatopsis anabasis TaxID=1840409 RepID=UPI00131EC395|nr:histidine kinase [Amycolatopsis anabasis]
MARGKRLRARAARIARAGWQDLRPGAVPKVPRWTGAPWLWAEWLPQVLVVACAVALAALAGGQTWQANPGMALSLGVLFGALQGLPLVLCLYRPMAGWWLSVVASGVVSEVARAGGAAPVWAEPSVLAHLCVLGLVALWVRPRVLVEMWLLTLVAGVILVLRMPPGYDLSDLVEMGALAAIVLVAANALRGRGEATRRLTEQRRITATERDRRAVLEERSRIARELHDVLAHHMSVIAIQAEAAPYRVTDPPEPLTQSFATIRTHAQDALAELRRVLGVLRAEGGGAEPAPQPTLAGVPDLVTGARAAGLEVGTAVTGMPLPLPPGLELSAYRIIQEALNNAMRHAPGSAVRVEIHHQRDVLRLRIVNGPPAKAPVSTGGQGHGMLGMRERVGMLKGDLTVGETPEGGYEVTAVLPLAGGGD